MNGLQDFRRMPTTFGPAAGPRNVPPHAESQRYVSDRTEMRVTARTDGAALQHLLPDGFTLEGEPRLTVSVQQIRNIGWLAGRGYTLLMVSIPASFVGREISVTGSFAAVVWENMADPIITGREEIGWPKLYADIHGPHRAGDDYRCSASWEGHRFFEMSVAHTRTSTATVTPTPTLVHRYLPESFGSGAQVDQVLAVGPGVPGGRRAAPDGRGPQLSVTSSLTGTGEFTFHPTRWEDMPTQFHVVRALAALPFLEFEEGQVVERSGQDDHSTVRVIG